MTQVSIDKESEDRALNRLLTRLAGEVIDHDGHLIWPPESFYHKLPMNHRIEVGRRARRNAEALAEHG